MGKALTSAELEHFAQDGYLPARRLATREQAADWRRQLEALEQQNGGRLHGALRYKAHLLFKWLADLIRSPALLDPIEDLIGPDILVWSTDWWIKEPRSSSFVSCIRTVSTGVWTPTGWSPRGWHCHPQPQAAAVSASCPVATGVRIWSTTRPFTTTTC